MENNRGASRDKRPGRRSYKNFAELSQETRKSGEDLEGWVYPSLTFGAVFWIPDEISGFGPSGEHPWVIVVPYRPGEPVVMACPRTSQVERNVENGLLLPAGTVQGLDRDGIILLAIRRRLIAADFRSYRHAGNLPDAWRERLRSEIAMVAGRNRRLSEEP
ncbi:MAG: hypothetical protein ACR2PL_01425 [Dehalococcoidia bacterium]